jgi:hypothetical protein
VFGSVGGRRIGEALGLRHMDLAAAEREVAVVPRDNGNGARSKSREPRSIPVSAGLIRLYADYLHGEYGDLDCDNKCSSTYGASRMAIRWATLPSTTWCGGCPDGHRLRPALVPAHGRHPVPTGAKLKDLMVSAGQSSGEPQLIYQHSTVKHQRRLAQGIDVEVRARLREDAASQHSAREGIDALYRRMRLGWPARRVPCSPNCRYG